MDEKQARSLTLLRKSIVFVLYVLAAQFIFGMIVNLYVQFPGSTPGGNAMTWVMQHSPVTMAHIFIGTLIVFLSMIVMFLTISSQGKSAILLSVLGFFFILFSWGSGMAFLTNGQQNITSFLMALGFILAIVVYGMQLRLIRHSMKERN
ncbi:hypothetical protein [Sulfoacidibacillus thermotolerans]|uniref:Multipass membrane protein n=1 Tax=Sulfoacidibacillus thermotolerans TaxID=1765684 RepID=A0A2U3D874_SULT2|nr:hypothetical protein [Sulfoacidibacillus thermotolerans]PWI57480.1 hypothetical protein BM613_08380 [Sulfoacidibacillus thermotolerans]